MCSGLHTTTILVGGIFFFESQISYINRSTNTNATFPEAFRHFQFCDSGLFDSTRRTREPESISLRQNRAGNTTEAGSARVNSSAPRLTSGIITNRRALHKPRPRRQQEHSGRSKLCWQMMQPLCCVTR